jgi:bacterial/archaeal transporter family-2 protein
MQTFFLPAVLTVGAGISVLIQQALNANLRSELNSAPWSGFMSYFLGVVCMVVLAAAESQKGSWSELKGSTST